MSDKTRERNLLRKDLTRWMYFVRLGSWLICSSIPFSALCADSTWTDAHRKYNEALLNSSNPSEESRQNLQKKFIQPAYQSIQNSLQDDPSTRSGKFSYPKLGTPRPMERASKEKGNSTTSTRDRSFKSGGKNSVTPNSPLRSAGTMNSRPSRGRSAGTQPGGSSAPLAPPPPTEDIGTMTEFGKRKKPSTPPKDVKFQMQSHELGDETSPLISDPEKNPSTEGSIPQPLPAPTSN